MAEKNDQNFIAFYDELKAYVSENHHFLNKHTQLLNKVKLVRRKINQGTLEEWKMKMFLEIAGMRDMHEHTQTTVSSTVLTGRNGDTRSCEEL